MCRGDEHRAVRFRARWAPQHSLESRDPGSAPTGPRSEDHALKTTGTNDLYKSFETAGLCTFHVTENISFNFINHSWQNGPFSCSVMNTLHILPTLLNACGIDMLYEETDKEMSSFLFFLMQFPRRVIIFHYGVDIFKKSNKTM